MATAPPKRVAYFATPRARPDAQDLRQQISGGAWVRVPAIPDTMDVTGAQELAKALVEATASTLAAAGSGIAMAAEHVMTKAKLQVPVRTGALRGSGFVRAPIWSNGQLSVEMGFGGPATPYALHVHEDLYMAHKHPTKAKFLEDPLKAETKNVVAIAEAVIKRALK